MQQFSERSTKIVCLILLSAFLVGWQIVHPIAQWNERIPLVSNGCDEQATSPIVLSDFVPDCWLIE